jgi:hypothetical protein
MASWIGTGNTNPGDVETQGDIQTQKDSYPTVQLMNYGHDNTGVIFDAYYDSGWKSSDAGSNFRIYKIGDKLRFSYASGVAQGSTINDWASENGNVAIAITKVGLVGVGTVNPGSKLEVDGGDIEVDDSGRGVILRSPDGNRWRVRVDNAGELNTTRL